MLRSIFTAIIRRNLFEHGLAHDVPQSLDDRGLRRRSQLTEPIRRLEWIRGHNTHIVTLEWVSAPDLRSTHQLSKSGVSGNLTSGG